LTAGEELLVDYRYTVMRQTLWGFGLEAKFPMVISQYTLRLLQTKAGKYGKTQIIE